MVKFRQLFFHLIYLRLVMYLKEAHWKTNFNRSIFMIFMTFRTFFFFEFPL